MGIRHPRGGSFHARRDLHETEPVRQEKELSPSRNDKFPALTISLQLVRRNGSPSMLGLIRGQAERQSETEEEEEMT
jgi:hypothetical protein